MQSFKAFLAERSLSADEKAKAEKIVKGMKKEKAGFVSRYGDKAKSVMYATATKLAKEEVQIDELSKGTLKNYTKKALDSIRTHAYISGHHDADNMYGASSPKKKSELTGKSVRYYAKAIKRGKGVQAAVNKLTKEETQINELKTDTMKKYIQTAADDLRHQAGLDAHYKRDFGKKPGPTEKKLLDKKHRKVSTRLRGIKTAADRIAGRSDWE